MPRGAGRWQVTKANVQGNPAPLPPWASCTDEPALQWSTEMAQREEPSAVVAPSVHFCALAGPLPTVRDLQGLVSEGRARGQDIRAIRE